MNSADLKRFSDDPNGQTTVTERQTPFGVDNASQKERACWRAFIF
jgi:hypothetical protein